MYYHLTSYHALESRIISKFFTTVDIYDFWLVIGEYISQSISLQRSHICQHQVAVV